MILSLLPMRKARQLAQWEESHEKRAIYHVVSRVINRNFVLQEAEKEQFVKLMRLYEDFCGVKILTYCIMSNHFHILVEIPPKHQLPDFSEDEVFLRHCSKIYSSRQLREMRWQLGEYRKQKNDEAIEQMKHSILYRIHSLSEFMKVLKQRFTQWFNKKQARRGTLWEDRFKSVIVESGSACRTMAAYIDLNPVRAGMVEDPKDYRWCGYGEAISGSRKAKQGLREAMIHYEEICDAKNARKTYGSYEKVLREYRKHLFIDGEETQQSVALGRKGFNEKRVRRVLEEGGKLSESQMLMCRVRYFVDGGIIGSKAFVEEQFQRTRKNFGSKRETGARKIRNIIPEFYSLRDLQLRRFC